jgi:hypothetical protein
VARAPVIPAPPSGGDLAERPRLRGEIRVAAGGGVDVLVVCTCGRELAAMRADHTPDEVLADPALERELYQLARRRELPASGFRCPGCWHVWLDVGGVN